MIDDTPIRTVLIVLALAGMLALAGCDTTGGPGDIPVTVEGEIVSSVPENATVVSIQNESIDGSPVESVARNAARDGSASEDFEPERSDEVADVFDAIPRSSPPDDGTGSGIYVRIGDVIVFLEDEWPP